MQKLIIAGAALAVLAGCATPRPGYYGSQGTPRAGDPGAWQVVSVTPVPLGTGARAAAAGETGTTTYSSAPVVVQRQPTYGYPAYGHPAYGHPAYGQSGYGQPVYVPHPAYGPEPVYQPRYYYPPISIGLGFNFGRGWGHHRGWGGHVGTRFPFHYRR
jgi:hypothetical protein